MNLKPLVLGLLLTGAAWAQVQFPATIYQVEPDSVYVEMEDHTAVRVKNGTARFLVNGAEVAPAGLKIGDPVVVRYVTGPDGPMPPSLYPYPAGTKGVHYQDVIENGKVVQYIWYGGRWHRM